MIETEAKDMFRIFFEENPGIKNPTDINRQEKLDFFLTHGWDWLWAMQEDRKQNTAINNYPNPWTKEEYWNEQN